MKRLKLADADGSFRC